MARVLQAQPLQRFSTTPQFDLLAEALRTAKRAKIAVLLVQCGSK